MGFYGSTRTRVTDDIDQYRLWVFSLARSRSVAELSDDVVQRSQSPGPGV